MKLPGVAFFVLFYSVATAPGAVLDWSTVGWPGPGVPLTNTYTNVGSSGVNVTVAFSGNTGTLQSGNPNTTSATIGGTGKASLQADVLFPSKSTAGITVTITFSKPVYVQNLNILDVDATFSTGGWQDQISAIKGVTAGSQTVNPVAVVGGGSAVSVTGGPSNFTAIGLSNTIDSSTSNVSVSFGNIQVTQISFLYSPGPNQPSSPQAQRIGLDNITFSLTPEVGPSIAAMTLCGLVILTRMRQGKKRRNDRKRLLDFMVS
jgi:hypothetical protein